MSTERHEGTQGVTIPFRLRGCDEHMAIEYGENEDPHRLGYAPEKARGLPVCRVRVVYLGEGYAAAMAWIQLARYRSEGGDTADKPPTVRHGLPLLRRILGMVGGHALRARPRAPYSLRSAHL